MGSLENRGRSDDHTPLDRRREARRSTALRLNPIHCAERICQGFPRIIRDNSVKREYNTACRLG
jgi:hypothetical protein